MTVETLSHLDVLSQPSQPGRNWQSIADDVFNSRRDDPEGSPAAVGRLIREDERFRSWYYAHTRTVRSEKAINTGVFERPYYLKVYDDCFELASDSTVIGKRRKPDDSGGERGQITELSTHAAGRLRKACLTLTIPGYLAWSYSLTVREQLTVDEYKACWKRFSREIRDAGLACIYRHEMQKRGVPHCHMVVWFSDKVTTGDHGRKRGYKYKGKMFYPGYAGIPTDSWVYSSCVSEAWRWAIQDASLEAMNHSAFERRVDNQDRWAIYMALHNSKKGQDGYPGKQWGIINRPLLREREHVLLRLSKGENVVARRRARKWIKAFSGRRIKTGSSGSRLTWGMGSNVPAQIFRGLGVDAE